MKPLLRRILWLKALAVLYAFVSFMSLWHVSNVKTICTAPCASTRWKTKNVVFARVMSSRRIIECYRPSWIIPRFNVQSQNARSGWSTVSLSTLILKCASKLQSNAHLDVAMKSPVLMVINKLLSISKLALTNPATKLKIRMHLSSDCSINTPLLSIFSGKTNKAKKFHMQQSNWVKPTSRKLLQDTNGWLEKLMLLNSSCCNTLKRKSLPTSSLQRVLASAKHQFLHTCISRIHMIERSIFSGSTFRKVKHCTTRSIMALAIDSSLLLDINGISDMLILESSFILLGRLKMNKITTI